MSIISMLYTQYNEFSLTRGQIQRTLMSIKRKRKPFFITLVRVFHMSHLMSRIYFI